MGLALMQDVSYVVMCDPQYLREGVNSFILCHLQIIKRTILTEAETQEEKQAPCQEPDVGLDPRTPGSYPGLKAVLNR